MNKLIIDGKTCGIEFSGEYLKEDLVFHLYVKGGSKITEFYNLINNMNIEGNVSHKRFPAKVFIGDICYDIEIERIYKGRYKDTVIIHCTNGVRKRYCTIEELTSKPNHKQVGGTHYKDMKIQPIEYTLSNGLGFCEGNVIKYISRYKTKNGVEDLEKAKHCIDLLIKQMEKELKNG